MQIGALFNIKAIYLFFTLALLFTTNCQIPNCNSSQIDPLRGCLNCTNNTWSVVNITTNQIVCSSLVNCSVVSSNGSCL